MATTSEGRGGWTGKQRIAAEAVTRLLRAADEAARQLEDFFAPYGVTGQQYNVLRILRGAGKPLPTMEVAQRMMQKTPGLTGILDRLERKGLLRRKRSREDRRVWLCDITRQGLELVEAVDQPLGDANIDALQVVRPELEALGPLLARLRR